jgi:hypothetical protein
VQIDLTALPEDSAALQSMIRDVVTATMQRDAQVSELTVENDKLRALIQKLLRHRFGRRSEQLSPDQLKLAIEDIEQEIAEREAAEDASAQSEEARRRRRDVRPRRNLGALPAHLPRDEVVIDIDSKECPCCGGALHLIDETRTEMLDIVPAQLAGESHPTSALWLPRLRGGRRAGAGARAADRWRHGNRSAAGACGGQ